MKHIHFTLLFRCVVFIAGAKYVPHGQCIKLTIRYGDVAQLGERRLCKPEVEGSSPFISTTFYSLKLSLYSIPIHPSFWWHQVRALICLLDRQPHNPEGGIQYETFLADRFVHDAIQNNSPLIGRTYIRVWRRW